MESPGQNRLGKKDRLKSRKLIEQLFTEGKSFNLFPYKVIYQFRSGENSIQAGFGASARTFKKAVDRNKIKRRTREAYRLQKKILVDQLKSKQIKLAVFFVYTGKELQEYAFIYQAIGKILEKLRMFNENNFSNT